MDLGVSETQEIALDVDGDQADAMDDEDGLDSDDDAENDALGIDAEESDGTSGLVGLPTTSDGTVCSAYARCPFVRAAAK